MAPLVLFIIVVVLTALYQAQHEHHDEGRVPSCFNTHDLLAAFDGDEHEPANGEIDEEELARLLPEVYELSLNCTPDIPLCVHPDHVFDEHDRDGNGKLNHTEAKSSLTEVIDILVKACSWFTPASAPSCATAAASVTVEEDPHAGHDHDRSLRARVHRAAALAEHDHDR
eukprot:367725_1